MADVFKFPCGGYPVNVIRKEDVLKTINSAIDKDVLLSLVEKCEKDCAKFLKEGRWAGIPFMGNIRIPETVQQFMSEEYKSTIATAKDTLDESTYKLFRKEYANNIGKKINEEKLYRHIVSMFVTKNNKFFKYMSKTRGDKQARVMAYTLYNPQCVSSNEQI